ncbi:MAG TPA: ABC transporter permease [Bacteroidota bacterium]|nr:ABC transporter permease [Bacteroidota bacterium]
MSDPHLTIPMRGQQKRVRWTLVVFLCGASMYALLTVLRFEILGASVISCTGSVALAIDHPSQAASLIMSDLFEYWIAAAAWCMMPVIAVHAFLRRFRSASDEPRASAHSESDMSARTHFGMNSRRAARCILIAFIGTAVCAPVLAPLPPLAQGDLDHTRFLSPASRGFCRTDVPEFTDAVGLSRLEVAVHDANRFLMHRSVIFSASGSLADSPGQTDTSAGLSGITRSHREPSTVVFLFGTDAVGRDIFSRVVYGARYSIGIGFVVVFFSVCFGVVIGMAAGFRGGALDSIVMRTVDVLMSIPSLFLVLTLMAVLGQSVAAMIIVLATTEWMSIARIVRGEVIHLREREFISASRLLGTSWIGTVRLHVLPNVRPVIISAAVLQLGNIFLAEASLSFLGLGIQAPNPSWGNMIADSMAHMNAPLSAGIFPGIALSVLIVAVHIIGGSDE